MDKQMILLHSIEWFEENAYIDSENDFFRSKEDRVKWENDYQTDYKVFYVETYDLNTTEYDIERIWDLEVFLLNCLSKKEKILIEDIPKKAYAWAIKKYLDPDKDVEYYI